MKQIKQAADELLNKFREIVPAKYDKVDGGYDLLNWEINIRECALVVIDELQYYTEDAKFFDYLEQVKNEIETIKNK